MRWMPVVMVAGLLCAAPAAANEPVAGSKAVRAAIARALPLLEKGSAGSAEQRTCFTCHNQALPVMAISEARRHGFTIDPENLRKQVLHTVEHLRRGEDNYRQGKGQGGQVLTAGYALWTLEAGESPRDDTTSAVTHYLLETQQQPGYWSHRGQRPPSSGSDFTATYVALRGLAIYGTDEQSDRIEARQQTVLKWLVGSEPRDTEDRVFRLKSMRYLDVPADQVERAIAELLDQQRSDGGWSQMADMASDAYATGSVLDALLEDHHLPAEHPAVQRGIQYLLDMQLPDGSWHVVTRAKPFQTYFESGFPHGKDQFISMAASSWAALALLRTLPAESKTE
ncbi:MAG: hypothetical protein J5I93_06055 [Pirellulaceae bacterium]|nr:hypothetical protein [Pirellulaceae bacterium]